MKNKMFSKLSFKSKAIKSVKNFSDISEKRRLESELIFGNLLEDLSSPDIESAYSPLSEEDPAAMKSAEVMVGKAQEASEQARKRVQVAGIDKQIQNIENRAKMQVDRLEDRKGRLDIMGMRESDQSEAAKQAFFMGRDGELLNYLVNGELAMISPEHKSMAKKFKNDLAIKDLAEKAKAQLKSEKPNMDLLKVLRYKIGSRVSMLERLEHDKGENQNG